MTIAEFSFGIDIGADLTLNVAFSNEDQSGDPALMTYFNLTGVSVRMSFRTALDRASQLVLALSVGSGIALTSTQITGGPAAPDAPNGFSWTITKAQSLSWQSAGIPNGSTLYYDAFVDTGGLSALYLQGTMIMGTTVT
jgi:hypothetical protein